MRPEEMEKAWADYLAGRKAGISAPDPVFTRRVMESVQAAEAARSVAEGQSRSGRSRRPAAGGFAVRAKAWIAQAFRPRPMMAMASLLLVAGTASLYLAENPHRAGSGADVTSTKGGGFELGFLLKRGNRVEPAGSGNVYLPGDRLQAVYSSAVGGYIHLYSIDAAGVIVCFSCPGENTLSPAGQGKTLDFALELDGSARAEAVIGFWTPRPASSADLGKILRAAWEKGGRDLSGLAALLGEALPEGGRVSVFHLHKRGKI
jgi:hypothetical protein